MNRLIFMRKLFTSSSLWKNSQEFLELPSALYICLENKGSVFSAVKPHIDISVEDQEELTHSSKKRNVKQDTKLLHEQSMTFKRLTEVMNSINSDIRKMNKDLQKINEDPESSEYDYQKKILENELEIARNIIKDFRMKCMELEGKFVLPYLQLPNILHKNTNEVDEDIFSLFLKPSLSFNVKSHVEIGSSRDELILNDVSPSSYFLSGDLALLELALGEFFLNRLKKHSFMNFSSTDIMKAVLAEGCGYDIKNNSEKFIRISDSNCLAFNHVPFLFGSSSLPAFVALFAKGMLEFKENVTIRLVSLGKKYSLNNDGKMEHLGLYGSLQSSCVSGFVVSPKKVPEEILLNEMAMLITQIYTEIGIHFKFIQYGAIKLKNHESLAIGICMYSPNYKRYIEVGRISLLNDFVSKRLQIVQIVGKKRASFVNMIFIEIANITKLIGCVIENTQTEDYNFSIPKCLKPFYYG